MEHPPTTDATPISSAITAELEARSLSLRGLASATNIPVATLHRRMAREGSFVVSELEAVCGALGLDLADVLASRKVA